MRVDKSSLTTPGWANYSCPTYYANRECVRFRWNSLYLKLRAKQSRNKCIVAKALWTELRSERTDMDLQHLFFDSTEELSWQGYFQWIYSLRAMGTPEINVQPCLSLSSGNLAEIALDWPEELANNKKYNTATG